MQGEGIAALEEYPFDDDIFLMEGEGLTVTASPETTQQMKILTKEEIDAVHAPDLASLLQETLDLGVTSYGGYGSQTDINMRGFDSERIAFLIDGVPANSLLSGEFDISMIDLNNIERIEVIYGGSDTKYNVSGALGGVINIITIKKQKPGLRLGGSIANTSAMPGAYRERDGTTGSPHWEDLGDTKNYSLFAGFGAEKFSLSANLFANRAGNHFLYRDTIFEKIRRKEGSEVWDTGASASFVRNLPDDYSKLIVSTDFYYGDKNIPTSGYSSMAGKQTDISLRQNIMLDMPRVFRDDLATEASVSYSWQDFGYDPPSGSSSLHDQHSITAINRWSWYMMEKLTFRSGWDYRFNYLDSTENGLRSRHDGGVYLTAEYKPHKTFLIIPSVKAVLSGPGSAEPVVAVPKLGFLWNVNDSLSLKNNYFRSFKHPDFEDLYWAGGGAYGNPDLRPEDGWGGDIGASYRFKKNWNIEGVFFTQWTNDSIHWYGAGGVWKPQNVGEAIFFGTEAKAGGDIPLTKGPFKKIGLSLSYQYLLSYLLSYRYTFDSDKRIPYMPMHSIGASVSLPWKVGAKGNEGSLLISGHYEGLRYAETANITELDPHFLLNLTVNQHINKNISAFAVARNILNTSYESFNDYPMPGLTITIGMRVNYEGIGVP
ncbi:TonB-dependent receptor [Spirochaetia bacterium]|nr:TonB-dependent receptor [Spirochaetia bacterium]GHV86738.1 TonB-dependent receptor [Spirochaetia bacterium]